MTAVEPVMQIRLRPGMSVGELVEEMGRAGAYNGGALSRAAGIYEDMLRDDRTTRFFGLAGAMVPAGMGGIVADLIERGMIDVLVTTGANAVHDIVEGIGCTHLHGNIASTDNELRGMGLNRIYDVFLPDDAFLRLEEFLRDMLGDLPDRQVSISFLLRRIGEELAGGILATAARHSIPVYCPAIQDSILGLQIYLHSQSRPFILDACADMKELLDLCYAAERAGALLVGGGVPKNYILQSMLITPKGFDYAIQLTGDRPDLGGLSGATLDEARSWGKLSSDAKAVTVYGDATITLPLLVAAVLERLTHG
ncbi:MAG: deoxyhypusine synthase [Methanomicrobiales archaeon]|nr:deoxyhypusine synthase [Methanomicrobiales archaeon]